MKLSTKAINAFLRKKGIDPTELHGKKPLKLSGKQKRKINERINEQGLVVLRRTNRGDAIEFVNIKFVKLAPRYHFEKNGAAAAANAKIGKKP